MLAGPRGSGARAAALTLLQLVVLLPAQSASASTVTMQACARSQPLSSDWTHTNGPAFGGSLDEIDDCGSGGRFQIAYANSTPSSFGNNGQWNTVVPPDMTLAGVAVPPDAALINPETQNLGGQGYRAGYNVRYRWSGGAIEVADGGNCCGGMHYAAPVLHALTGRYFIVQVTCDASSCQTGFGAPTQIIDLKDLTLVAEDDVAPQISTPRTAGSGINLADAPAFVRGAFTLAFSASNTGASGVCGMRTAINGASQPTVVSNAPQADRWMQCPATDSWSQTVDTAGYPDGELSIAMAASDAAAPANVASLAKTVTVDNLPVSVNLAGPVDVPAPSDTTSATVTAAATAGPSGVAGLLCSLDHGPWVEHPGPAASLGISGIGGHEVDCYAQNNAIDAAGAPARSDTQTHFIAIRRVTAEAISFTRIQGLRCRRVLVRARIRTPAHTVVRHRRRVRLPAGTRTVRRRVVRCRARTTGKRLTLVVIRHGRKIKLHRTVRVVIPPRAVNTNRLQVAYGHATTVSGYLGLTDGTPLAEQAVTLLAAPDNGSGDFSPIARIATGPFGTWTSRVPPGPSRLIQAVYGGSGTQEPAISAPVRLSVPARIRLLKVTPRVAWGQTVAIVGKLYGGYLPPAGAVVRLRYGYGRHARATFGVLQHVTGDGRFSTSFTFGPGPAALHVRFWFSATLLAQPDYPFAAASSPRRYVVVGGHPGPR